MSISIGIWYALLVGATLCTVYSFFVRDRNNYTDAIFGTFAIFIWIYSGFMVQIGILDQNQVFQSTGIFLLLIIVGLIVGLITAVRIMDIMNERQRDNTSRTTLRFDRL